MGECTFVTDVLYYPIGAFISINHAPIYSNKGSDWAQRDKSRSESVCLSVSKFRYQKKACQNEKKFYIESRRDIEEEGHHL